MGRQILKPQNNLVFQSHIGAIRISYANTNVSEDFAFQSHIGAIRIDSTIAFGTPFPVFQSHIGAIRITCRTPH